MQLEMKALIHKKPKKEKQCLKKQKTRIKYHLISYKKKIHNNNNNNNNICTPLKMKNLLFDGK